MLEMREEHILAENFSVYNIRICIIFYPVAYYHINFFLIKSFEK